jgi:hypothetical protein
MMNTLIVEDEKKGAQALLMTLFLLIPKFPEIVG